MPLAEPTQNVAASRFVGVVTAHWPAFAVVLAALGAVAAAGLVRGRGRIDAPDGSPPGRKQVLGWATALVVPPVTYVAMFAAAFSVQASIFAALLAATVIFWVFSLVDEFVPPLVAVVATLIIGLAPADVALAGFSSPSLLLLLGVYALSAVISASGLSYRFMLGLLLRLPDRPLWHRLTLLGSGYLLSPLMPSNNARLSLLMPVYRDMVAGLRLPPRGPAITALLAAMFSGATLFSPMMSTSKSSNIAALSLLPNQIQSEFAGFFWLFAAAVAAVGVTAIHLLTVSRLFPAGKEGTLPREETQQQLADMGPVKPSEWIAAAGFGFFLIGCATVSWHHVKPPYLAGCVLLALLLTGTLARRDFQRSIDWPMIVFLLGIDSLMRIMNHLGLAQSLARAADHSFDFVGGHITLFILVALVVTLTVRLALPVTAGMLTSAIVLLPVAAAQGIHPWICVFCTAVFSDIVLLPHQGTTGLIQIRAEGLLEDADERGFMRYNMVMNLARVVVVFASIPWWKLIGLL
jgi:di/tricarboxylate transporter